MNTASKSDYMACAGRFVMNPRTGVHLPMTPPLRARVANGELVEATLDKRVIPFQDNVAGVARPLVTNYTPGVTEPPQGADVGRIPRDQDVETPKISKEAAAAIEARPAHEPADIGIPAESLEKPLHADEVAEMSKQADDDLARLKALSNGD